MGSYTGLGFKVHGSLVEEFRVQGLLGFGV